MGNRGTEGETRFVVANGQAQHLIHLDTSFLIRALVAGSSEDITLRDWLRRGLPIGVSAIVWAEFLCGPLTKQQADMAVRIVGERFPFGGEDAALAASLYNAGGRRKGSLVDCMIAAAAIRSVAVLATANEADFARFASHGLRLAKA